MRQRGFKKRVVLVIPLLLLSIIALSNPIVAKVKVATSIEPITFLVEQIGKENVQIVTLIGQGKNPHSFSPSPGQIKKLNNSQLYFITGTLFEQVVKKMLKQIETLQVIDLDYGFKKREMKGHDHEHLKHGGRFFDPHIWLSSSGIKHIVNIITGALSKLDPLHKEFYQKNQLSFIRKLDRTILEAKKQLSKYRNKLIFVFHPAFGHFLDEYGLKQEAIELEGKLPTPKHIANLIKKANKERVKVIFVQPQFSQKAAKTMANAIRGKVESINPLRRDVLKNIKEMASTIHEAYK